MGAIERFSCDQASGTCGFLVAANEYLRSHHPEILRDAKLEVEIQQGMEKLEALLK